MLVIITIIISNPFFVCFSKQIKYSSSTCDAAPLETNTLYKTTFRRYYIVSHLFWGIRDDTQLKKCAPLSKVTNLTKELNACTDDIKTWMTENQLKLNDDKTEALLFPFSSSLKPSTVFLPDLITLGSHNIPFSDSARNLGFILD